MALWSFGDCAPRGRWIGAIEEEGRFSSTKGILLITVVCRDFPSNAFTRSKYEVNITPTEVVLFALPCFLECIVEREGGG